MLECVESRRKSGASVGKGGGFDGEGDANPFDACAKGGGVFGEDGVSDSVQAVMQAFARPPRAGAAASAASPVDSARAMLRGEAKAAEALLRDEER